MGGLREGYEELWHDKRRVPKHRRREKRHIVPNPYHWEKAKGNKSYALYYRYFIELKVLIIHILRKRRRSKKR